MWHVQWTTATNTYCCTSYGNPTHGEECRFHAVRTLEAELFEVGHVLELVGDCSAAVSAQIIVCTHHTLLLFQRLLLDGRSVQSKQITL